MNIMTHRLLETLVGFFVVCLTIWFVVFFAQKTGKNVAAGGNYNIKAKFSDVTGIVEGSKVTVGGVSIGVVQDKSLDPQTYLAVLTMNIDDNIRLPIDSSALIASSGLIGDKFVAIEVGAEDKLIDNGGEIKITQSSLSLESLIGKMIFSKDEKK